jgi:ABC-type transporter Mla MlaB component
MKREPSMDDLQSLACRPASPGHDTAAVGTPDVAVLPGVLVERHEDTAGLQLTLFGRLDGVAADLLQASLLADLPHGALLDLSRLDRVDPAALRGLVDRQRDELRAGRQLLLRIAPHQVSELSGS